MFHDEDKNKTPPICDLVPGYGFYNSIGLGLAEGLVNLSERLLSIPTRHRKTKSEK